MPTNNDSAKNKNLSLKSTKENSAFYLITAEDYHVSLKNSDFSSEIRSPQVICVAGGGRVIAEGLLLYGHPIK